MNTILVGSDGNSNYSLTAATRNITITGINWTLEAKHVGYILNMTTDLLLYAPIDSFPGITVSGGVITYDSSKTALASGDLLHIQLFPPDHGFDSALDAYKTYDLNPDYAHYTSPEALIAEEDQADAAVSRYVIPFESYKNAGLDIVLYSGAAADTVTLTMWATNDATADDSADTGWIDKSTPLLGAANISANDETTAEFVWLDTDIVALKFMIKLVYAAGGTPDNGADVIIKKA